MLYLRQICEAQMPGVGGYEEILRRKLDSLDDEFETLRLLSQELSVKANGLRFRKAA